LVEPLEIIGAAFLVLAGVGIAYLVFAGLRLRAFREAAPAAARPEPPVTVLKPLHGEEPGLEAALETVFGQDYTGKVQVVFGVQDPADPALAVAERLRARHPEHDVAIVVDPRMHGTNRKVSNLINMSAVARHDILVLADSDISVGPDWLRRLSAELADPAIGVVSLPYSGAAQNGLWSRLAALGLTTQFLPSVVVGLALGMAHPCMGSTIALRREVLAAIGGFEAFADLLADDYAIGRAVRAAGYRSAVPPMIVSHACAESSLRGLVAHELRWARTVRSLDPAGFAGSGVTHAVVLALIGVALTGAAPASLLVLVLAAAARIWMVRQAEMRTESPSSAWWLIVLRDVLAFAVFVSSFFVRAVDWRGTRFRLDDRGGLSEV
jgi:ceramide glucosyltransferase